MKSFADWTDDIRTMMNPPKPVDGIQASLERGLQQADPIYDPAVVGEDETAFYGGAKWPDALTVGTEIHTLIEEIQRRPLRDWEKAFLARANGADPQVVVAAGRQCGKTAAAKAMKELIEGMSQHYGPPPGLEDVYEYRGDGTIKFLSTDELKRRGIL